jgi:hypothetical protein
VSEIRQLLKNVAGLERQVRALSATPQLGYSSLDDANINEYDRDGQIVGRTGKQHDGTHGSYVLSGPVPPTPTAPTVTPTLGGLKVRWDGLFVDDAIVPMDFARVEVHVSAAPSDPADTAATLVGTIETPRGGELLVALPAEVRYVRLRARALSGKLSEASAEASGTPLTIQDEIGDIGQGTQIFYGPTTPTSPAEGDLWYFESAPGQYVTRRYVDGAWVDLPSEATDEALAEALAAKEAAAGKNQVFKDADEPTATAVGDLWIDTDDGNRIYRWNGTFWESTQFGNGAIQPNSLVASDLVVVGTIETDLLAARAVTADKMAVGTITAESAVIAEAAITDANIANLNVGKLTGGTLDASVVIGGELKTAATGARAVMDLSGIHLYDETEGVVVSIDPGNATVPPRVQVVNPVIGSAIEIAPELTGDVGDNDTTRIAFTPPSISGHGWTAGAIGGYIASDFDIPGNNRPALRISSPLSDAFDVNTPGAQAVIYLGSRGDVATGSEVGISAVKLKISGDVEVGNSGSNMTNLGYYRAVRPSDTLVAYAARVEGDVTDRLRIRATGSLDWGDGVNGFDTALYRTSPDTLATEGRFFAGDPIDGVGFRQVPTAGHIRPFMERATADFNLDAHIGANADISGATMTVTTTVANAVVLVTAHFDAQTTGSPAGGNMQGGLMVDGVFQSGVALQAVGPSLRTVLSHSWVVTLASTGSHTLKLVGQRSSGTAGTGTILFRAGNTVLTGVVYDIAAAVI